MVLFKRIAFLTSPSVVFLVRQYLVFTLLEELLEAR
jgi:hypothetical protein